ncbi:MAG: pyridoxamine 5'-phosphate oxidase family protein [Geminicoccaceae bacterium]
MRRHVSDVAFTASVKAEQEARGSRAAYARMEQGRGWSDRVDARLAAFLAERDSFYLATTNAEGQPYIQHRGGPPGFLKILDERTLGFADYPGNRQYITLGNLEDNPKAFIFLMDYARRGRVKIWGTARVVEDDPELIRRLADPGTEPERAILLTIEAWDINCPKHITPRFTLAEIEAIAQSEPARSGMPRAS